MKSQIAIAVTVFGVAGVAFAGPVTINLTGYSSQTFGGITINDPVSASITYDTVSPPTGGTGNVRFFVPSTLNSFSVGLFSYTGSGGKQAVIDNQGGVLDKYASNWTSVGGASQGGFSAVGLLIQFTGDISVLSSPASPPSPAQMLQLSTQRIAQLTFRDSGTGSTASVLMTFDQIEVIDNPVIPLPTGAAMVFVGLGMIGVRRRRSASPNEV